MKKLLYLIPFLIFALPAHAQCTGSGVTWNCPAGVTSAQIQTMINSATDNAVATFAPGTYTVSTTYPKFSNSKGITVICATAPPTGNIPITAWSVTSNVATFTAVNSLTAGQSIALAGFGTSTVFNGRPVTVLASGLSGTQFQANFPKADGSATEAGVAVQAGAAITNACQFNSPNKVSAFGGDLISGTNTHLYRISGFTFDAQGLGPSFGLIYFDSYGGGTHSGTLKSFRIDHNTFQNGPAGAQFTDFGTGNEQFQAFGVIDHNVVTGTAQAGLVMGFAATPNTPLPSALGTGNNIFVEDNILNFTTVGNISVLGCNDGWGRVASYVVRHNYSLNCGWVTHGATHGGGPNNVEFYSNYSAVDAGAVSAGVGDGTFLWRHQGSGTVAVFSNRLTPYSGHSSVAIEITDYRAYSGTPLTLSQVTVSGATTTYTGTGLSGASQWYMIRGFSNAGNNVPFFITSSTTTSISGTTTTQVNETGPGTAALASQDHGAPQCDGTVVSANVTFADGGVDGNRSPTSTYRGYPCWHQPGRDFSGNLMPMYGWDNLWTDNSTEVLLQIRDFGGTTNYFTNHMQNNRDAYNAVSTSAQSNATTPFNGTTGMGFGTLANRPTTCTPTPEALDAGKGGVGYFATDQGAQGKLYNCSATNTWSLFYEPYTYPHPLVSAGTPVATFTPSVMSFGNVTQGTLSSELQMVLSNAGGGTLTLSANVTLSDTTNFTLVGTDTTCVNGTNLTAGQTCIIAVKANPTGTSTYTSTLTTLSNASTSPDNDETFSVTGTAVVTPGNPIGLIGMVFSYDKYGFYKCTPYPCATVCYSCSLPFGVKRPVITFK